MQNNRHATKTVAGRHHDTRCCSDAPCDSGLRNHYFEGKRLTADRSGSSRAI